VRVRIKRATVVVDSDDLREPPEKKAPDRPAEPRVTYDLPDEAPATELDLRGMTTDDVREAIERHVGRALLMGLRTITIVHGKGTGALRSKTHEILGGLPNVRQYRIGKYGEGDTGVTIVELD
jgi:DNA mismatch repair protein MutS2